MIFTSSQFSTTAKKNYHAESKKIALIDYDKLCILLSRCSKQWVRTASDIWISPSNTMVDKQGNSKSALSNSANKANSADAKRRAAD